MQVSFALNHGTLWKPVKKLSSLFVHPSFLTTLPLRTLLTYSIRACQTEKVFKRDEKTNKGQCSVFFLFFLRNCVDYKTTQQLSVISGQHWLMMDLMDNWWTFSSMCHILTTKAFIFLFYYWHVNLLNGNNDYLGHITHTFEHLRCDWCHHSGINGMFDLSFEIFFVFYKTYLAGNILFGWL